MLCDSPQLVLPVGKAALEVPCGICRSCDVQRRLDRMRRFAVYRSKVRNYGGSNETS